MIMKNIMKSYVNIWIHLTQWIHDNEIIYEFIMMNSSMNSLLSIQCYEEYREIMAEFLEMNSRMKSWLNSLISTYS